MGSWGTGFYQNDIGLDVRGIYRECKKFGFRGGDLAAVVRDSLGLGAQPESEESEAERCEFDSSPLCFCWPPADPSRPPCTPRSLSR